VVLLCPTRLPTQNTPAAKTISPTVAPITLPAIPPADNLAGQLSPKTCYPLAPSKTYLEVTTPGSDINLAVETSIGGPLC